MNDTRSRIKELFLTARGLGEAERETFLRQQCGDDDPLAAEVRRLLRHDQDRFQLLDPPSPEETLGSIFSSQKKWSQPLSDSVLRAGAVVGDFELIERIGQGGMGTVWKAQQRSLQRFVALKTIRQDLVTEKSVHRFEREARASGRLQHRGIVAVHATGEIDGIAYIVQELVGDGSNLSDALRRLRDRPRLPEDYYPHVAGFVLRAAEAMVEAHTAGVVHRDLKPQNILVDEQGDPKITDFGLARVMSDPQQSGTFDVVGTYLYMSPEQAAAKSIGLDHRTDVFSLGVVLYEMLTLQRPFEGDTPQQVLERILYTDPPAPREVRSRVPYELSVICMKALQKRREHRYQTMTELAEDLGRALRHEPIRARPPGPLRRVQGWTRRHPTMAVSLLLGVTATAIISGLLLQTMAARDRADSEALAARASAALARAREQDVLRLADLRTLEELEEAAEHDLWPAHPLRVAAISRWLDEARRLASQEGVHRSFLAALEDSQSSVHASLTPAQRKWWVDTLSTLIARMERFLQPEEGIIARMERHLDLSRSIQERSVEAHASRWEDALTEIAFSERYGGLELQPLVGLVPLGPDPDSGLWEFCHLESGATPLRDPVSHRLRLAADTGLVLVLIPGGTFRMGTQSSDPERPHFDQDRDVDEALHDITLPAFFLSKFELTQAQWTRVMGQNPSSYAGSDHSVGADAPKHPVEQISWLDAERAMRRLGLTIPTEAQWEYAARAGATSAWYSGPEASDLKDVANLADQSYINRLARSIVVAHRWNDRYALHAPAGSFEPNDFGLHDTLGNVWEWCQDWYTHHLEDTPLRATDGLALIEPGDKRVVRGGGYADTSVMARLSNRSSYAPHFLDNDLGLRPARGTEPFQLPESDEHH